MARPMDRRPYDQTFTVSGLCEDLGFGDSYKSSHRHWRQLSKHTFLHLHPYISEMARSINLQPDSPVIQKMCRDFCRTTPGIELFDKSPLAVENGWPTLPDDEELICETLAKLLYMQEYGRRKTHSGTRKNGQGSVCSARDKEDEGSDDEEPRIIETERNVAGRNTMRRSQKQKQTAQASKRNSTPDIISSSDTRCKRQRRSNMISSTALGSPVSDSRDQERSDASSGDEDVAKEPINMQFVASMTPVSKTTPDSSTNSGRSPPVNIPSPPASRAAPSKSSIAPRLKMIFQNANRTLDFPNPLTSMDFKDTNIAEFFELYSRHCGTRQQLVKVLTFVLTFANQTTFVLKKDDDDEIWRCMKERFKRLFWRTRSCNPDEKDFEIWVELGDTGSSSQAVPDEDDW